MRVRREEAVYERANMGEDIRGSLDGSLTCKCNLSAWITTYLFILFFVFQKEKLSICDLFLIRFYVYI